MSVYSEYIRGMIDSNTQSKTYWCAQKKILDMKEDSDSKVRDVLMVCDKLISLEREADLLRNILNQFMRYDLQ